MLVINAYNEGLGTKVNKEKMVDWSERLGSLENTNNETRSFYITTTRLNLARLYGKGNEIAVDPIKSYTWYLLFNEHKSDLPEDEQQAAIAEIQQLETQLTIKQRKAGKKAAQRILEHRLNNLGNLYRITR